YLLGRDLFMKNLPNGWKKVELSEILESIENGNRPKGGITDLKDGIPSIGGEHINSTGGFNLKNIRFIPYDFYFSMKRGKIQKEDVLVVKDGATTGKVSFVGGDFPYEDAAVNEHVFILRGKKDLVHQQFLFYHLYSPIGQRQMDANFHGAAIGGINTQFVKNYNLVLPPLPTQKKIAAVLEKAEKLREWRKEADGLTDRFLKSTFLEMFGDPATNPKGWEIIELKTEIKDIRYGTGSPPEYNKEGIPFIRATNIKNGTVEKKGLVYISKEEASKIQKCKVKTGDLILVRSGVNTGDCARIPPDYDGAYAAYDLIIQIPYPKNYYYNFIINSDYGKSVIEPLSRRAAQPHINAVQVKSLQFQLPPLQRLEKFASIVQQVEQIRAHQTQSGQHIENFFNVLMQRAFRGELEAK
ncbi:MAG: restriction endonuclease subunit S, partial [Candidatus Methanoperedens sp.]|nr:restriction endonuclease subunit S [Candidatus Methanoperedens sp.]